VTLWDRYGFSAEPAAWVGLANALVILAIAFGVPIDTAQKAALDAVLVAGSAILVLRPRVTPIAKQSTTSQGG
jgi:hypothetical protein